VVGLGDEPVVLLFGDDDPGVRLADQEGRQGGGLTARREGCQPEGWAQGGKTYPCTRFVVVDLGVGEAGVVIEHGVHLISID
jgi:hypothetical protein